jgi:hypothetical protein
VHRAPGPCTDGETAAAGGWPRGAVLGASLRGGAVAWRFVHVSQRDREEGSDGASGLPGARRKDRAVGNAVQRRWGSGVDRGASPRRGRVVCVRLARLGLPEEGGGVGDVAGSRQMCLPAIGGRHRGSVRGRRKGRAGCRLGGRGVAGGSAGHPDAAKTGGGRKISMIFVGSRGGDYGERKKERGGRVWVQGGVRVVL